jgi:hydroxymethylpyrimidine pyrophosphatase-like HAD family hydrolase
MAPFPKLLVIDLDGTSLGGGYEPYGRFPDHYSAFLDRLDAAGCRWAINTAWDALGQWHLLKSSSVKSRPLFFMAELGCRLWTPGENAPVAVEPFNATMERRLAEANATGLIPFMREMGSRFTPARLNFYGHWFDMTCVPEETAAFCAHVKSIDWKARGLSLYGHKGNRISVVPGFLGKHANLGEALRLAGLKPEEVVVAGDERADLAMMRPELAHHHLCPDNAHEDVKEHIARTGGAVGSRGYSDGVMEAFQALAEKHGWPFP